MMVRSWFYHRAAAVWLGAACTVISWAGLANYRGTHHLIRSFDAAAESHRALEKLQIVQVAMESAESSVDEYVITGNLERLGSFRMASRRIPEELRQMEALLGSHPAQIKSLQPLERMTLAHLSYLRNVVRVRRTRGAAAAAAWIASEDSGSPRGLTQQLLGSLKQRESMDVRLRTAFAEQQSNTAKTMLSLAALISLGFLVWAFTLWRRESRERLHAEHERQRLHRFLYSIIDRIPYSVLVKEARALRVVHANQAAAGVLGRSTQSLVGTNVFDWRPKKEAELEAQQDRQALAAAQPIDIPGEQVTVADQTRIFHTQKVAIPDAEGQPAYLVTISEDITERKHAEHLVELSRDAAIESARLKAEFLRNMSHEFRTPLSIIIGMSSLLEGTSLTHDQNHFAGSVRKAAEGLSQLAKNILDFSKIETGRFQLEAENVPITETVESVVRMFSEQAAAKGIELTTAFAGDVPPLVWGDRARFCQVLTQLIGNAVKFTAKGAVAVRVSMAKRDDAQCWVACRVIDTGPGISAETRVHLFDAFRQGDGSATRRFGGTGIGLAIAKRIVELMGGEIGFESPPPSGATFWITIPFDKKSSAERPVAVPPRVIVVEENETFRGHLKEQLVLWGLTCETVGSGEATLTLLRRESSAHRPLPLLLIGLHLLDMEGTAFAQVVRKNPSLSKAPLVALVETPLEPALASALGFSGSIAKGLPAAAFYAALIAFIPSTSSAPKNRS